MDDIINNNSILEGATREVQVEDALTEHARVAEMLINLRVEIWKASLSIQPKILHINEFKSQIAMLGRMSTTHGLVEQTNWRTPEAPPVQYEAVLRKNQVDEKVKVAEARIDELQEEIDHHNATTTIKIELEI